MDRALGWIDRDTRKPTSYPAIVVLPDERRVSVGITNITKDGCQVEGSETLPIGQRVRVELAGDIKAHASVRWAIVGRAGLRFDLPLDQ